MREHSPLIIHLNHFLRMGHTDNLIVKRPPINRRHSQWSLNHPIGRSLPPGFSLTFRFLASLHCCLYGIPEQHGDCTLLRHRWLTRAVSRHSWHCHWHGTIKITHRFGPFIRSNPITIGNDLGFRESVHTQSRTTLCCRNVSLL